MKTFDLPSAIGAASDNPNELALVVDQIGRVVQFTLAPNEALEAHKTYTPVYFIVVQGAAIFTDEAGVEHTIGLNKLVVVEAKAAHSVRAGEQGAVVLGFLHWAPAA